MAGVAVKHPERLIFEQALEGLFLRGLKGKITPSLNAMLKDAGLNLGSKLMPAYSTHDWWRFIDITAKNLYPDIDLSISHRLIGEHMVEGYRETFIGKAVLLVIRAIGPKRTLARTRQNFRSGNNYTEVEITDVSPNCVDLWINEDENLRHFTQGVMLAGMRAVGTGNPNVEIREYTKQSVIYRISW